MWVWKIITQEPSYEINCSGHVRNIKTLERKILVRWGKGGYWALLVDSRWWSTNSSGGKRRRYRIHRLVAELFLVPDPSRPHVNHKDGDKSNNHVSNLEWCTVEENNEHYRKRRQTKVFT